MYERYLEEQEAGQRVVLVAMYEKQFAGYVTIVWQPEYVYVEGKITPEIQDLNVLPQYQRCGIGSHLMNQAEVLISARSDQVGIGVGLHPGYNAAQRLYVLRGYVPDARGMTWRGAYVREGQHVIADDDLVLHLIKDLQIEVS